MFFDGVEESIWVSLFLKLFVLDNFGCGCVVLKGPVLAAEVAGEGGGVVLGTEVPAE